MFHYILNSVNSSSYTERVGIDLQECLPVLINQVIREYWDEFDPHYIPSQSLFSLRGLAVFDLGVGVLRKKNRKINWLRKKVP